MTGTSENQYEKALMQKNIITSDVGFDRTNTHAKLGLVKNDTKQREADSNF